MLPQTNSSIINDIAVAGKDYAEGAPGARSRLVDLGRALAMANEIPSEFVQRVFWAEPALAGILRIFVDKHVLALLKDAGTGGLSGKELSDKTGVEQLLLERFLRHLFATGLVSYVDGRWHGTPLSDGLSPHNFEASIEFCHDVGGPSFHGWPTYFKKNGYQTPIALTDSPLQHAHKTDLPFFPLISATPQYLSTFNTFMSTYRAGHAEWFEYYPVVERLVQGFDATASDVLLVDVGGGKGHDLVHFAAKHPNLPGRLVLQDRPDVIDSIQDVSAAPFEAAVHDFFTPQPVNGARAYMLHSVLHDWDDEHGVQILENLKPALKKNYSRVLLNEIVLSEVRPTLASTNMDVQMLAFLGGAVHERTETEWRNITEKSGYKVTNIYSFPGTAESIIEVELA